MVLLAVLLTFVGTALGVAAFLALVIPAPNPYLVRLRRAAAGRAGPADPTSSRLPGRLRTGVERVAERLGHTVAPQNPQADSKSRRLLLQAGHRRPNAVWLFYGYRVLLAVVLPSGFLSLAPGKGGRQMLVAVALSAAGLLVLPWWLRQCIKRRQREIFRALPNTLDLMVVCTEAGLGLDATIQRVAREQQFTKQALSEELQIVSQETRAGRPRVEALLAMKERVGLTEVVSLVLVLVQAEKMGTGIARALRVHAESVRTKRRQMAEERAAKIPLKMVFPLVLCIFPATLLVILGPSYIMIVKAFTGMGK